MMTESPPRQPTTISSDIDQLTRLLYDTNPRTLDLYLVEELMSKELLNFITTAGYDYVINGLGFPNRYYRVTVSDAHRALDILKIMEGNYEQS
jgi:hypothetical protein